MTSATARSTCGALFCVGALLFWGVAAEAATLHVGPNREYKLPSSAATAVHDGDVVEIDAATYKGDVAVWRRDRLTIRGVGGKARLDANGNAAEEKAIWVIKGRDTVVENIEFFGAHVPDQNGAGIRQEGENLIVRHCYFHDNENGILGGAGEMVVEYSEFANNGFGDGQSHNMYISQHTRRFTLRGSYTHGANVGHNVKSRARENRILYNRITDGPGGNPSYSIDLPNGGLGFIIGNIIQQGGDPENNTLVSYGAEGARSEAPSGLYVVNNTFVNDYHGGIFIRNVAKGVVVRIVNNIFAGAGKIAVGGAEQVGNWNGSDPGFVARANGDFHLRQDSIAIDRGVDPGKAGSFDLAPSSEYVHPLALRRRQLMGKPDAGAYEFSTITEK